MAFVNKGLMQSYISFIVAPENNRTLTILPLIDRRCWSIPEIIESPTISTVFLRHLLLFSTLHSNWFCCLVFVDRSGIVDVGFFVFPLTGFQH